jgi:archaellum biogenesis ATPase FlaH
MGEIRKFVEDSKKKAVILIDGLEFLISVNTYDRMLQFVNQVRDIAVTTGSIVIIPFDMRTLNEREQALLERNLQVIQTPISNDGDQIIQISSEDGIRT